MKKLFSLLFTLYLSPIFAKGDRGIGSTENGYRLTQLSQNLGYDNQPSFWSEDALLYAATQNGQTDIVFHQLATGEKNGRSATGQGSEYSPLRIPSTDEFSAIRLDTTGLQRLYRYNTQDRIPT